MIGFLAAIARPSVVYFFRSPATNLIKIGRTRFMTSRRAALEYEHGPLELLGVMLEPDWVEADIHRAFRHCRMHGEWFEETRPLAKFIAANARPWTPDMDEPGSRISVKIDRDVYYKVKQLANHHGADVGDYLTQFLRPLVCGSPVSPRDPAASRSPT